MTFAAAVRDSILSGACAYLGQVDNANRFFNELSPVNLPNFAKYWRPKLCNEDPANVPEPQPPFNGGQCPNVLYDVSWQYKFVGNNSSTGTTQNVAGPIALDVGQEEINGVLRNFGRIVQRAGTAQETKITIYQSTGDIETPLNITGVVRDDGQPDTCGDPPIEIPPYPPTGDTYNISPTYVDNSGNTVNLNGSVTLFAPVLIAPVTVIAPVRVSLGGVDFNGTLELAPDFNFNFGQPPSTTKPGRGDEIPEPDDPANVPDTPEDSDNPRLIGTKVTASATGNTKTTEYPQGDGPTLYLPRLASCYFRVRNSAGLSWSQPFPVRTRSEFIPVPRNMNAIASAVWFETGWSGSKSDVYSGEETPDS